MAKGIVAFMVMVALILSMSMLSGIGFYEELGLEISDSADDDVQAAYNAMVGQDATDQAGGSVLQDFTTSAGRTLSTGWQVISNLAGILKLFFGLHDVIAESLEKFWMITYSVTFAAFIRGVVLQ